MALTDDLHRRQVYPDFLEAGKPSRRVVLPTLAVVPSAPVVRTLGGVVQPALQGECSGEDRAVFPGVCRRLCSAEPECSYLCPYTSEKFSESVCTSVTYSLGWSDCIPAQKI